MGDIFISLDTMRRNAEEFGVKEEEELSNRLGITLDEAVGMARKLVEKGMTVSNAAKEIAAKTPFKKGDIYRELV